MTAAPPHRVASARPTDPDPAPAPASAPGPARRGLGARIAWLLGCLLYVVATGTATLGVLAWLLGRVLSDRSLQTQWLLWIPTPALLVAVLLGLVGALGAFRASALRRWSVRVWLGAGVVLGGYFALVEHRLLHRPASMVRGLEIVHWNMSSYGKPRDVERHAERVLELLGDVTVLAAGSRAVWSSRFVSGQPDDVVVRPIGSWGVLVSRVPILELRTLTDSKGARAHLLRIDGGDAVGEVVLYLVDLPSNPRIHRLEVARDLRRWLDGLDVPPPDIVVGDLNIPRGSRTLRLLFPDLRHAYDEGGHGYAASFHRRFPLYHIDHVLLADGIACERYDLVDPGFGRHHVQRAWVVRSDGG